MFAEPHDQVGILVLEDESSTMDLVVHYLEGASRDARISTAECLGAALGCLAEQRIDLAFKIAGHEPRMDRNIPLHSGF